MRPEDIAEGFQRLSVQEGLNVLTQLDEVTAAQVLLELPADKSRQFLSELPDLTLAYYLDVLPMDDALELSEDLDPDRYEALLEVIPSEDAQEIRRLLSFPERSVARSMTEDFFEVGPKVRMEDVLADIRSAPEGKYETVNDIYVLDDARQLIGVFSLRQAIRANPSALAEDVMVKDVITVTTDTPAEEAGRLVARYGFYAMPVADQDGRMLGIFTVDDAQEIVAEADTEDVLKLGAVSGDAEPYMSLGVFQLYRRRFPWLLALFVAETLTGWVMRYYGQSQAKLSLAPLTFFIPLLIGAGGNSGSQVTTTITRALALGDVATSDWGTVLLREIAVAFMIGASLGLIGFLRAYVGAPFGWNSGLSLSLVVACALPLIVLWAAALGSLLPIGAKKIGIDPAVMSAPFITTFVDATGLVIYFEIAIRILG